LANRPLIREQAFGEALNPDKLERLGRYEVHLDRKLERMLAMLSPPQGPEAGVWPRADPFGKKTRVLPGGIAMLAAKGAGVFATVRAIFLGYHRVQSPGWPLL